MLGFRPLIPMMQVLLDPTHMVRAGASLTTTQSPTEVFVLRQWVCCRWLKQALTRPPIPRTKSPTGTKQPPPTDWSQFLLDPLILQQFYAQVFQRDSVQSLEVCTYIRSFLDLPQPLPPFQNTPHRDPTRLQRLDHMFTRAQRLSSINSCRSKLHTGFPSDHYLLVTEIQVKLAQRKVKPSYSPKLDFSKVDQTLRDEFNRAMKDTAVSVGHAPDHTAKITFFTDGSASQKLKG